ncbi:molybdopterin cofactor-binding domain-containing protein [Nocardia crassostreae]|uniref:molybdopterin cofactor-binding domain-containing protein n=1 Tax=Nocardia crassostreae TaxID=53428 RepID=UPI000829EECF|nr:molybdopterin cofactor-binding domain-containing protein [Nocardia crassostreae]
MTTAHIELLPDGSYELRIGTAGFGNGTTARLAGLAAGALGTTVDRIRIRHSGEFGAADAGAVTRFASEQLRRRIMRRTVALTGHPADIHTLESGGVRGYQGRFLTALELLADGPLRATAIRSGEEVAHERE